MNMLTYSIALILIIAWAIGIFGYSGGSMILVLIAIAIITIIIKFFKRMMSR